MEGAGSRDDDHQVTETTTLLLIKRKINALILFIQLLFKKLLLMFSSSKTNLPISIEVVNINNGGSTGDDARSHRYKYRTGGTSKIMVQLCFAAALLILPYSQQIQLNSLQQSPPQQQQQVVSHQLQVSLPAFQLLQVFFILGFSASLGGILFSFIYPFTAKVLETSGTVFGVLGFFLAMAMVVDIYFKSLLWVIWFTGVMTLLFILVNAVHELQGLWN